MVEGQVVTVDRGTWTGAGPITFTYQWAATGPAPDAPGGVVCAVAEAGCGPAAVSDSPDLSRCAGLARMVLGGKLDLNRAGFAELDLVPGVGPATARALVAARRARGPFPTVGAAVEAANLRGGAAAALKLWTEAESRP